MPDGDDSNILSFSGKKKDTKRRQELEKIPATKADIDILFDKIIDLERENDRIATLLNKTIRVIGVMSKRIDSE